jgi:hypothetical protein
MFKNVTQSERAERDQNPEAVRINAAIDAAEKAIVALAAQQLGPDEIRKEWCAIRDRTTLAIRNALTKSLSAQTPQSGRSYGWYGNHCAQTYSRAAKLATRNHGRDQRTWTRFIRQRRWQSYLSLCLVGTRLPTGGSTWPE